MDLHVDVKEAAEELAEKLQKDPGLLKDFQKDPIKAVEKLMGVNLPAGIKAKLAASDLGDKLDGLKKLC